MVAASHTFTTSSEPPAAMRVPFEDHPSACISYCRSAYVVSTCPMLASHCSIPPVRVEMRNRPSGDQAKGSLLYSRIRRSCPVIASHTRTPDPSCTEAKRVPSGDQVTPCTLWLYIQCPR